MIKNILFGIMVSFLVGCASPSNIVVQRNDVIILPRPQAVNLDKVVFDSVVIDQGTYFTLTPEDYQKLSINIHKIIKYSKDTTSIIESYEMMIIDSNKPNLEK